MKLFVCLLLALVCLGSFGEVPEDQAIMEEPEVVIDEPTKCNVEVSIADGCVGPANIYGDTWFKEICNRHDVCYACGASVGMTKIKCDQHIVHLMRKLCDSKSDVGIEMLEMCEWYLEDVHIIIGSAGNTEFNTEPLAECGDWVKDCLSHLELDSDEVE